MGKHAAGTGLQLCAGRVPEIGAAVWVVWQLWIRAAVWYGVGEGVALVLRGFTSLL